MRVIALAALGLAVCSCSSDPDSQAVACELPAPATVPRAALPEPDIATCDAQGWCFEHPVPFRGALGPIWHKADQTILTSVTGLLIRLRNEQWEALPALPRPQNLTREDGPSVPEAIWASGDKIYIAGSVGDAGVAWIFDGADWTSYEFTDGFVPRHVWGTRPNEVMMVGEGGARLYQDGTWTDAKSPRIAGQGVWGCKNSFFASLFQGDLFGEEALVAEYNGEWTQTSTLPEVNVQFSAISGSANNDIFASGTVNGLGEAATWHFDGKDWREINFGNSPGVNTIVALGEGRAVATGLEFGVGGAVKHFDGTTWEKKADRSLNEISAATAEDILGRENNKLLQYDGDEWFTPFEVPVESVLSGRGYRGVWTDGEGTEFFVTNNNSVTQRNGATLIDMPLPQFDFSYFVTIWGANKDDLFVVGSNATIVRYNNGTWARMPTGVFNDNVTFLSIWGSGSNDVFAGGNRGHILHYDGTAWTRQVQLSDDSSVIGIWGSGPNDVWAVTSLGLLAHYDGTTWQERGTVPTPGARPRGIWGSGPNDIWIPGRTKSWRYNGSRWAELDIDTTNDARAVWGRSSDDVYIVGTNGMVFHWDGVQFNDLSIEGGRTLSWVWGDSTNVRVIGSNSTFAFR